MTPRQDNGLQNDSVGRSEMDVTIHLGAAVEGRLLVETLGRVEEYAGSHERLDDTLAPRHDPFSWVLTGLPPKPYVSMDMTSTQPEKLTWRMLEETAKQLTRYLRDSGTDRLCSFIFWQGKQEFGSGQLTLRYTTGGGLPNSTTYPLLEGDAPAVIIE